MVQRIVAYTLLAGLLTGLLPNAALAEANPGVKVTRGVVNVLTGWLEVPRQIGQREHTDPPVYWFIHGLVSGLGMATARTFYGIYDMITFPFPPYNSPVMDPETLIHPGTEPRHLEKLPPPQQ